MSSSATLRSRPPFEFSLIRAPRAYFFAIGVAFVGQALAGVEYAPARFEFTALDNFKTNVSTFDDNGCKEGEIAYCAARNCIGYSPEKFSPYKLHLNSVCYNNTSNIGGIFPWCPQSDPANPFVYDPAIKQCTRLIADYGLSVDAGMPFIPTSAQVKAGKVNTKANLLLTVTKTDGVAAGVSVAIKTSRPAVDMLTGPSTPTNSAGQTTATTNTYDQTSVSVISGADNAYLKTLKTAQIAWLPAQYESPFLVTCYRVASEAAHAATEDVSGVPGLPESEVYKKGFLKDTKMQGSGQSRRGEFIHYDGTRDGQDHYSKDSCARTASGKCAVAGETIAVDPTVIPRNSTVNVATLGTRKAQDTGGRIKGYHIDEYKGPSPKVNCRGLSKVTFTSY